MKRFRHVRSLGLVLLVGTIAVTAFTASATGAGGPNPTAPPTISGTAKAGETLTVTPGTWATPPTSVAYRWQRCSDTGTTCSDISGATATTYVPTSADVGNTDRVVAVATDAGGTSPDSPSAVTAVIVSGAGPRTPPRPRSRARRPRVRRSSAPTAPGPARPRSPSPMPGRAAMRRAGRASRSPARPRKTYVLVAPTSTRRSGSP